MAVVISPTNTSTPMTMPTVAPADSPPGLWSGGEVVGILAIRAHDHSIYSSQLIIVSTYYNQCPQHNYYSSHHKDMKSLDSNLSVYTHTHNTECSKQ